MTLVGDFANAAATGQLVKPVLKALILLDTGRNDGVAHTHLQMETPPSGYPGTGL